MTRSHLFGRLAIRMDEDDTDTPVIVSCRGVDGEGTATFECAITEAEIEGYELTKKEMAWLESWRKDAEMFWDVHWGKEC